MIVVIWYSGKVFGYGDNSYTSMISVTCFNVALVTVATTYLCDSDAFVNDLFTRA